MEKPEKKEHPSTYFVEDRQNQRELTRLVIQDRMITASMGGPLPEQTAPSDLRRVLDVGCGTGSWVIEAAQLYPDVWLAGIDVSLSMIQYAREQAEEQHLSDRIEFRVMDALRMLEYPAGYFDLVNMRLGSSFLRTWDWPRIIGELSRVTRQGGIIRITDTARMHVSNSPAHQQFFSMLVCAFTRSGHLFEGEDAGISDHLVPFLSQHIGGDVQSRDYALEYRAPEGEAYLTDMQHTFSTLRPFIQHWGCLSQDYDDVCQRAVEEMRQSDFHATWNFRTAWCIKGEQ